MGFLIDTNLWIAIERGKITAADIYAITKQEPLFLSPVNLAEIRFGVESMTDARQKQRAMAMLRRMRRKPLLHITGETGETLAPWQPALPRPDEERTSESRISGLHPKQFNVLLRC